MKKLTAVLALLILQLFNCSHTEATSHVGESVYQNGVVGQNIAYSSPMQEDDSLINEFSYLSTFPTKEARIPYIKQITGAICLLYAWLLLDSYKE